MASTARSALLRQTASASRTLATLPSRTAPSCIRSAIARPAVGHTVMKQATAFHSTPRQNILPPPPQVVDGTINDPQPLPKHSPVHGSYHWTFERGMAAALVPLSVAPFAAGSLNPTLDAVLCAALLVHSHLGMQSIIIDYVPKRRYPGAHRAVWWGLNAATAVVGLALYEFETNDVGLTEAIRRIWKA